MKPDKKNLAITLLIIFGVLLVSIVILTGKPPKTDEEVVKCIASKAVLYTQLGCSHCKTQEEMFGNSYQYLDVVDCWYERQSCVENNISATPTWAIDNTQIVGVQTINRLRQLTGC